MTHNIFSKKTEINYLYFSILFCIIGGLTFLSLFTSHASILFFTFGLGQALLEVGMFALLVQLFSQSSWIIAASLFISLLHFIDFTMVRVLDASITYLFNFFFGYSLDHICIAFQALNLNAFMIAISALTILAIPLIGILLYRLTEQLTKKRPWSLSIRRIAAYLSVVTVTLFVFNLWMYPSLDATDHSRFRKSLPFGNLFIPPKNHCISLEKPFASARSDTPFDIAPMLLKPNLYIFVIETLRKDFVTSETAPHLTAFGSENIDFPASFSNANATHLSWFSIFHADFPHHWTQMRDTWTKGSVPLQLLKKVGYKIRAYSSADLRYFGIDELVFGKNCYLLDSKEEYMLDRSLEPCDRDALALQGLKRDLLSPEGKSGNVFIVFLDATHSEYSFPQNFPLKFQPIAKQIDYLIVTKADIEPIQNRYKNAIAYIDSLVGSFFTSLKEENLYDDAIIAITGDHGEEFFEEGSLFHGTHLNHVQTSVPIFLKLQKKSWQPATNTATHMDIFPSILHFLTGEGEWSHLFDGQSVFMKNRWPFRLAVLQNGACPPKEFLIAGEKTDLCAKFLLPNDLLQLEMLSWDTSETLIEDAQKELYKALDPLLQSKSLANRRLTPEGSEEDTGKKGNTLP